MNTLAVRSNSCKKGIARKDPLYIWVAVALLLSIVLAACAPERTGARKSVEQAYDSQLVEMAKPMPPDCASLPYCGYLEAHSMATGGTEMAARAPQAVTAQSSTLQPDCDSLPICRYIRAHDLGSKQIVMGSGLVIQAESERSSAILQPECGSLPICDYIRMHNTGSTAVAAVSIRVIPPDCRALVYCDNLLALSTRGVQVVLTASLPVTGGDSQP